MATIETYDYQLRDNSVTLDETTAETLDDAIKKFFPKEKDIEIIFCAKGMAHISVANWHYGIVWGLEKKSYSPFDDPQDDHGKFA